MLFIKKLLKHKVRQALNTTSIIQPHESVLQLYYSCHTIIMLYHDIKFMTCIKHLNNWHKVSFFDDPVVVGNKECWHLTQELGLCTAVLVRQISHILQLQNTSLHTLSPIWQSANDETHHTVSNTRVFFMHSYKPVCNCWKLWYKISLNILQKLEALGLNVSSSL